MFTVKQNIVMPNNCINSKYKKKNKVYMYLTHLHLQKKLDIHIFIYKYIPALEVYHNCYLISIYDHIICYINIRHWYTYNTYLYTSNENAISYSNLLLKQYLS